MALELKIRDTQDEVKIRNPWAVALLPIPTLLIYHFVWWYRINRELCDLGRARGEDLGDNPTLSLLAVFPGGLLIVPAVVSYWRGFRRVQRAAELAGVQSPDGWLALILYLLLAPAFWAFIQTTLNEVWEVEGSSTGAP